MTVDKQAMIDYVKSLGYDPTVVAGLSIDYLRTTATLRNQPTDIAGVLDFLESQGIDTDGAIKVELWNGVLKVTRHKRDKYGDFEFAVDVATPAVTFKEVSEEYEIG